MCGAGAAGAVVRGMVPWEMGPRGGGRGPTAKDRGPTSCAVQGRLSAVAGAMRGMLLLTGRCPRWRWIAGAVIPGA